MSSGRWDEGALLVRTFPRVNVRRYNLACPYCDRRKFVVVTPGQVIRGRHICSHCWLVFGFHVDSDRRDVYTQRLGDDQRRRPLVGQTPLV